METPDRNVHSSTDEAPCIVVEDCDAPVTPPMNCSDEMNRVLGLVVSPQSPPYRSIRNLKIMGSPQGPRPCTLFSSTPIYNDAATPRRKLVKSARANRFKQISNKMNLTADDIVSIYGNPFTPKRRETSSIQTPNNKSNSVLKRTQRALKFDSDKEDLSESFVKPRLSDFSMRRFDEEFVILDILGSGAHGCVYKCVNKLDGCTYAVKKGTKPVSERVAWNEIYAHAALSHLFIVKNYSSWFEDTHVYMQNEYCNGGSLEGEIKNNGPLSENELWNVLSHITEGLRFLHAEDIVHMDIKPGNIFISKEPAVLYNKPYFHVPDEYDSSIEIFYKIGDLGHVTSIGASPKRDIEEGDCRYLPREILNDDFSNLTKVDIFALGLTLYEAAGGGPLQKNGEQWHSIRDGNIMVFPDKSPRFNSMIKQMIHPDPLKRPSAVEIIKNLRSHATSHSKKDMDNADLQQQLLRILNGQQTPTRKGPKDGKPFKLQNSKSEIETRAIKKPKKM